MPEHRDHRGDADRDPERRQRGAQPPRAQPDRADAQHVGGRSRLARPRHRATDHAPSRSATRRGSAAAISRSCVITSDRRALARCSSRSSATISAPERAVEVAGRLVGEHDRRPPDERARDRHALALAARQLLGAVVEPVRRARRARAPSRARRRRSPRGVPRVEQPLWRRCRARVIPSSRKNCWNTKPIRGARRPASSRSPSSRDVVRRPRDAPARWAGRACPSRAAASTCPSRTARRPRAARPRSTASDTPRSASTPPG